MVIRKKRIRLIRDHLWRLAAMIGLAIIGPATFAYLFSPPWLRPSIVGGAVVAVPWLVTWFFGIKGGTLHSGMGAQAETWTARELRRGHRGGDRVLHGIRFENEDVDHVMIGPDGLYVIETTWSSHDWHIGEKALDARDGDPIGQVTRGARRIRLLLAGNYGLTVSPQPVLALWGRVHGDPAMIDGVWVSSGDRLRHELPPALPLTAEDVARVVTALRDFQERQRQESPRFPLRMLLARSAF